MDDIPISNITVQWVEVQPEQSGQRIDNFLLNRLKGVPKSHIYRILRTGEIRRNGGRVQASDRLATGDTIRIPPLRLPERRELSQPKGKWLTSFSILHEDDELLIVNKPAGIAVHGGSGIHHGIIEGLRFLRPSARFLELVHRLDRDTSGCLLIAKKPSALRALHEQFRDETIQKVYLALFTGVWSKTRWMVDVPLQKNVLQSGERVVKISRQGKPAITEFRRRERYTHATLVEARPLTGRTHQVRVHAQYLGHPLAGDDRYGNDNANREFRQIGLRRLFLHALRTTIHHPRTGELLQFHAPLPSDLAAVLQVMDHLTP